MSGADRSGEMAAFVQVVEHGGFSAAARELELTPSAMSKLVTRIEARLGVRLLNRSTRQLSLTPEGEIYFARSQRILAEIAEAEAEVTRARGRPSGRLRINVGTAFGMHQLTPKLPLFSDRYPEVEIELTVTDRIVDIIGEGADIALRAGPALDPSFVARKICDLERVICASPEYLARHGTPREPLDLLGHNCITIIGSTALKRWPFQTKAGEQVVEVGGTIAANNAETVLQLALQGVGVIRLIDAIVGEDIRRGRLVPVLPEAQTPEPIPLYAVLPAGRHRVPRAAVMIDFLLEHFGHAPWRVSRTAH